MPSKERPRESPIAIYGAIAANIAIATTKLVVALLTGSAAMLSEAVHSIVDTGNGILLLWGVHRSQKPPDAQHPFGHGAELYFWSLIVAVLIFGLGGGVSFYEGVSHFRHPRPLSDPFWNYVVLGAAFIFESISFAIAWRQFRHQSRGQPAWRALRMSKDPTTYTVIAEDGAALIGLVIAAIGIALSHAMGVSEIDSIASMLIGLLLAGVAILLVREARGLLVGEGVQPETAKAIIAIARAPTEVLDTGPVRTMYLGPQEALLTLELQFAPHVSAARAAELLDLLRAQVQQQYPVLTRVHLGLLARNPASADVNGREQPAGGLDGPPLPHGSH